MSSVLTRNDERQKWYPNPIADLEGHLRQFISPLSDYTEHNCRGLAKNIAYSIQYLEFVDRCLEDIKLSDVLFIQNIKTFVIVSCSVIEALFFYLLRAKREATITDWRVITKVKGQPFKSPAGRLCRVDVEIYQKKNKEYEEMTFDSMCKRVESKKLVKLSNDLFYKALPQLRKLRNRVHVQGIEGHWDTDYIQIEKKHFPLAKQVLYLLLTSELFEDANKELFGFLAK